MIKDQIITVTNKSQLIIAFGCSIDFVEATRITLIRKTGKTFYNLYPYMDTWLSTEEFNKTIKKARAKIRNISAECFR